MLEAKNTLYTTNHRDEECSYGELDRCKGKYVLYLLSSHKPQCGICRSKKKEEPIIATTKATTQAGNLQDHQTTLVTFME